MQRRQASSVSESAELPLAGQGFHVQLRPQQGVKVDGRAALRELEEVDHLDELLVRHADLVDDDDVCSLEYRRPEKVYEAARALQASVRSPGALALGSRCQRLPLQPETVPGGPQRVRRLWPEGP